MTSQNHADFPAWAVQSTARAALERPSFPMAPVSATDSSPSGVGTANSIATDYLLAPRSVQCPCLGRPPFTDADCLSELNVIADHQRELGPAQAIDIVGQSPPAPGVVLGGVASALENPSSNWVSSWLGVFYRVRGMKIWSAETTGESGSSSLKRVNNADKKNIGGAAEREKELS